MGYRYSENINISFPYAGIQVNALSNLISNHEGGQLLIDYGDLYGNAVSAIRETGLNVIQLKSEMDWKAATKKITGALNFSFTDNPGFTAADRTDDRNIFIRVPGVEINADMAEYFVITPVLLHPDIIEFLNHSGRHVFIITDVENHQLFEKTG